MKLQQFGKDEKLQKQPTGALHFCFGQSFQEIAEDPSIINSEDVRLELLRMEVAATNVDHQVDTIRYYRRI